MKKLITPLAISTLLLTGCSDTSEPETTNEATTQAESTTQQEGNTVAAGRELDPETETKGEVGKRHGTMCNEDQECEVFFTIDALEKLDTCDETSLDPQAPSTYLVRMDSTVSAPAENANIFDDMDAASFMFAAQWSVLDKDGVNRDLLQSQSCLVEDMSTKPWWVDLRTGDTEKFVTHLDIPEGAQELRLTAFGFRWVFDLPA